MDLQSFAKIEIAISQINTAIDIYMNGQDLFSVITLAGAGEEILARFIKMANKESSLKKHAVALLVIHQEINKNLPSLKNVINSLNKAKNSIKHMDDTEDDYVIMDPRFEAEAMLHRAIENYYTLTGQLTEQMESYYNKVYFQGLT